MSCCLAKRSMSERRAGNSLRLSLQIALFARIARYFPLVVRAIIPTMGTVGALSILSSLSLLSLFPSLSLSLPPPLSLSLSERIREIALRMRET